MGHKKAHFTTEDLLNLFGYHVKFYRNLKGWSQEKLAECIDVSKNTIYEIEAGKKFARPQNLVKLAAAFNIDVFQLMLPLDVFDYDKTKNMVSIAEYVKDNIDNLLGDFIKKPRK